MGGNHLTIKVKCDKDEINMAPSDVLIEHESDSMLIHRFGVDSILCIKPFPHVD